MIRTLSLKKLNISLVLVIALVSVLPVVVLAFSSSYSSIKSVGSSGNSWLKVGDSIISEFTLGNEGITEPKDSAVAIYRLASVIPYVFLGISVCLVFLIVLSGGSLLLSLVIAGIVIVIGITGIGLIQGILQVILGD